MRKALLLIISLSFFTGNAQDEEKTLLGKTSLSGLKFRSVGPALTSGRIADIAVNPKNHNEYYVAVASGGVWKTANHGVTYSPIFDGQGSYSIGCVTIDPNNENIVWVGTGENNNQRSVAYGDGLYKSEDGGKSWKNVGLKKSEHIGMIKVHPNNSNVIYVAAYGPLWSAGGDRGIHKSTDGGKNWELVLEVSEHTGFNEIHFDPRDPNILYATAHQRRRHVWTYLSGGPESAIYKSSNAGKDWVKLEKGIPSGDKGRITLAIAPANPDIVYAMIEGHGTYRSTDRGASFSMMSDHFTSGNYYVELVPHPYRAEVVYSMDTYMHVTKDGGKTFTRVKETNKHVDNHCLWINPDDVENMIAGCDGGIYETFDGANNWHFKPNLPVTQFYRVAVDNAKPFYNIYGGTQDNFSLGGPSRTINTRGIVNSDWFVTNTGDGFESQIDPVDPNIVYAQAQYGWLVRYDKKSGESVGLKPFPPKGAPAYRYNWDAPLLISPHDHKTLYFAANKVFKSTDQGNNWTEISPDLTQQIDRHKLPIMGKIWSVDAVKVGYDQSTSNYGNIVALDESILKKGLIFIGTDDGLIQVTEDGGQNWQKIESFSGVPKNTYVNAVLASRHDTNVVYAVFNNHKNGDFKPYVLRSTDKGRSWQNITSNLPERGSVYAIQQDHVNKDLLFVGTEFGLFFTNDGGKEWKQLKADLPTIAIRDIDIQRRENDLVLASLGRGFYVLDNYAPLRDVNTETLEKDVHVFDIKDALAYLEATPLGYGKTGFQGASYYAAKNPPIGAVFRYYLKETPKSKKSKRQEIEKKKKEDGGIIEYPSAEELRDEDWEENNYLLFIIRDAQGNEVSRFTKSASTGVNQVVWDGQLSSLTSTNTGGEPLTKANSIYLAPPGQYSVEIMQSIDGKLAQLTQPKTFTLNWLDNNTFKLEDKSALIAFQKDIEDTRRKMMAVNRFKNELKKKIGKLKANVRNTPNANLVWLEELRGMEYQINKMEVELNGDQSLSKRYFDTPPSLLSRINSATWNSYNSTAAPTGRQRENLRIAQEEMAGLINELEKISGTAEEINQGLIKIGAPYLESDLPKMP